jgi:hypothetical protein
VHLGRYLLRSNLITGPARQNTSVNREWLDPNGDFIIQGDPLNPARNGELGASNNLAFGQPRIAQNWDPDFAEGFGVRSFNWEWSAALQHELLPRVGINAAYFRRWYGNFQVTDNLLVGPSDYSPYCVTAPSDSRLDLNPDKRGQTDNLITTSSKFGKQVEHWDGVDVTLDVRVGGASLQGGVSTGKTTTDTCEVAAKLDNPSQRFCHSETPFLTQIKLGGSYRLPWNIQIAGTLQSFRSNDITASATFTNAQIQPSLRRPLTTGSTATISLIEPDTIYNPRFTQLDLRFARTFTAGRWRMKGMVDLYNALNINTVLDVNNTYGTNGAAWLVPTEIAQARFIKVGAQLDF